MALSFFEYTDGDNDLDTDARHDTERQRADKLVAIAQILLESVDREQCEIGLLLGVAQQVDVHQLADLAVARDHVLHDVGKELGHVTTLGDESNEHLQTLQLLAVAVLVKQLADLLDLAAGAAHTRTFGCR